MPWFRVVFLFAVLMATSGYTFRCTWFCTDQTAIQNDYVEQRDRCRQDAQLKLDTDSAPLDDNARKAQLISSFSQCMAENGWTVPDAGKEKEKPFTIPGAPPVTTAPIEPSKSASLPWQHEAIAAPAPAQPNPVQDKASISRTSECAFARQAADVSSIAAARAKACDLECDQALKVAPEAPRPAACPADFKDSLSKGTERE